MKILILYDYRGHFYSSTRQRASSLDYEKIKEEFIKLGYEVVTKNFTEINFVKNNYKDIFVVYQSAEDPDLHYKSYIEDVLLGLTAQGAILIPDFYKFRAHHNKVFMEILRDINSNDNFKKIKSSHFGTYEDFIKYYQGDIPAVLKSSEGSKSRFVKLLTTSAKAKKAAREISRTYTLFNLYWKIKNFFDKKGFKAISNYRKKFIVQNYVKNLKEDYKIVIYGNKYFVLCRGNRPKDFRASGSGILSFPSSPDNRLLDFAKKVFDSFKVPFVSLDVGFDGTSCYLFEFQFVSFGQYAVEKAPYYFVLVNNEWVLKKSSTNAEHEFVNAIHAYIKEGFTKKSFVVQSILEQFNPQ